MAVRASVSLSSLFSVRILTHSPFSVQQSLKKDVFVSKQEDLPASGSAVGIGMERKRKKILVLFSSFKNLTKNVAMKFF